jgi:hypothetical protein
MIAMAFLLSCFFTSTRTATVFCYFFVFASGLIGYLLLRVLLDLSAYIHWVEALQVIPNLALYRCVCWVAGSPISTTIHQLADVLPHTRIHAHTCAHTLALTSKLHRVTAAIPGTYPSMARQKPWRTAHMCTAAMACTQQFTVKQL